jgi:hypothetical protein
MKRIKYAQWMEDAGIEPCEGKSVWVLLDKVNGNIQFAHDSPMEEAMVVALSDITGENLLPGDLDFIEIEGAKLDMLHDPATILNERKDEQ